MILKSLFPFALVLLTGCAATNLATSPAPATVQEEWTRKSLTVWGGTRVFAVGNLEFGKLRHESDTTFTVDHGPHILKVWYYANRGNAQGLYWQTDVVPMTADLKPNGRYQVRADDAQEELRFSLVDLATNQKVAETPPVKVVRRPSPQEHGPTVIPIFIPR